MNQAAQVLMFELPEVKPPTPGEKFSKVWQEYKDLMKVHQKAMESLRKTEENLFPGKDHHTYTIGGMSESAFERALAETARDMRQRMAWMAARQFAPSGTRVEIDEEALACAFPVDRHSEMQEIEAFDPVAVWAWLEARYGGDVGETLAWRQLAKRLHSQLPISRQKELVVKGGFVILSERASTESWSSGLSYSVYTVDAIRKTLLALGEVAAWMERHQLSRDLYAHVNGIHYSSKVESREKFGFGEQGAEVQMVTFKTSVEYRLSMGFAEQLQIFLATYGEHEE